jgi:hypothetical protein
MSTGTGIALAREYLSIVNMVRLTVKDIRENCQDLVRTTGDEITVTVANHNADGERKRTKNSKVNWKATEDNSCEVRHDTDDTDTSFDNYIADDNDDRAADMCNAETDTKSSESCTAVNNSSFDVKYSHEVWMFLLFDVEQMLQPGNVFEEDTSVISRKLSVIQRKAFLGVVSFVPLLLEKLSTILSVVSLYPHFEPT